MFNNYDDFWTARAERKRGRRRKKKCGTSCGCTSNDPPIVIIPPLPPPPITTGFRSYTWAPKFSFGDDDFSSSPGAEQSTKYFHTVDIKKNFRCAILSPLTANSQLFINDWKTTPKVLPDLPSDRTSVNIPCDPFTPYDLTGTPVPFPVTAENGVKTDAMKFEFRNLQPGVYQGYDTLKYIDGWDGSDNDSWTPWQEPLLYEGDPTIFETIPPGRAVLFYTKLQSITMAQFSESLFTDVDIGGRAIEAHRFNQPAMWTWKEPIGSPIDGNVFQIRMSGGYSVDGTEQLLGFNDAIIDHFQDVYYTYGDEDQMGPYQYLTLFINYTDSGPPRREYNIQSPLSSINRVLITPQALLQYAAKTPNQEWLWPKIWTFSPTDGAKIDALSSDAGVVLMSTKLNDGGSVNPLATAVNSSPLTRYLLTMGESARTDPTQFDGWGVPNVKVFSSNEETPLTMENNPTSANWRFKYADLSLHESKMLIDGSLFTPYKQFTVFGYSTAIGAVPGQRDYTHSIWLKNQVSDELYYTDMQLATDQFKTFSYQEIVEESDELVNWLSPLNNGLNTADFADTIRLNLIKPQSFADFPFVPGQSLATINQDFIDDMENFLNHDALNTTGDATFNTLKSGIFVSAAFETFYAYFQQFAALTALPANQWLVQEGNTSYFEAVLIFTSHFVDPSGTPLLSHDVLLLKSNKSDLYNGTALPPPNIITPPPTPMEGVQVRSTPKPTFTCINKIQTGTTTLPTGPALLPATSSAAAALTPICPDLPATQSRLLLNLVNRSEVRVEYLRNDIVKRPFRIPYLHAVNANFTVSNTSTRLANGTINTTGTSVQLMAYNSCSRFTPRGNLKYFQNNPGTQTYSLASFDATANGTFTNSLSYAQGTWPGAIFTDGRFHQIGDITTTLPADAVTAMLPFDKIWLYDTAQPTLRRSPTTTFTAESGGNRLNNLFPPNKYRIYAKFDDLHPFDHGRSICFVFRCGKIKLTNIETNDPWTYTYDNLETEPNSPFAYANFGTIPLSQFSKDDNSVSFYIEPGDWGAVLWGFKYLKKI